MTEYAIETNGLTKHYGRVHAVNELNLRVPAHTITGFLGRNGSGKSSTIRMLLGMSRPSSGTGRVLGLRIDDARESREIRRRVAHVAEDKRTYGYATVAEMIAFTRDFYGDWRPDVERQLLAEFELPPKQKVQALSKGMSTKLALLLALARQPQLLVLDEPSEGLDPVSIEQLLQTLVGAAADGVSVFFSSHQIAEVERVADHICIIDDGRLLVDASLEQIRQDYRRISMGFSEAPPHFDIPSEGVLAVRTDGRQITVISARVEPIVERALGVGAISVDTVPISLRELFLETVKGAA